LLRFLSFFWSATWQVRRAARRHGGFDAVYSPGPNCRQVDVAGACFCQARQLALYRSGQHRPPPASATDWLKLAHRWSYAASVARVEKWFYSLPTLQRVITPSHLLARDLRDYYGLPEERVTVAHSGVDCTQFTPEARAAVRRTARRELALGDDDFAFFLIGNNWLIKGLQAAIRALPQVPRARLLVVGLGAERPESWQRLAKRAGVAGRITFLPRRPDILFYYAAADALLAPSVYDTFAMMPLEALACGLPVILSRNTGVAELTGPEHCLLVSQVEDPAELAAAMRRMMDDHGLRARLAASGALLARGHSWDRLARAVTAELEAVARKRRNEAVRDDSVPQRAVGQIGPRAPVEPL
jgi:glycosyltransferase involved in cell wall biosynthesis